MSVKHPLKAFGAGLVWLTAAATLVAGLPQRECVCPDGQVKSICLVLPTSPSSCCCHGSCCPGKPSREPLATKKTTSCCSAHEKATPKPSARAKGHQLKLPGCTRAAGKPTSSTPSSDPTKANKDNTPQLDSAAGIEAGVSLSLTNHRANFRQLCLLGPPPDLTVLFQHFTI
jgi:hypothetical protein